jgi:ParB family chromosome partitioning protein
MTTRSQHGTSHVSPFARRVVRVASIIVGDGFDSDISTSNIDMLAAIVRRYGLRDAITITSDHRLVAGARWLAAVRKLGWETVEVAVVEGTP